MRGEQTLFRINPARWWNDLSYVSAQTAFGLLPWLAMTALRHGGPAPPPHSLQVTGGAAGLISFAFIPAWLRVSSGDPETDVLFFEQCAKSAKEEALRLGSGSTRALKHWASPVLFPTEAE